MSSALFLALTSATTSAWLMPSAQHQWLGAPSSISASRRACVQLESEMQYRKRMEAARGRGREGSNGGSSGDVDAVAAAAPVQNAATDVDDLEFFGSVGGPTLTREAIASAQKTTSPRLDAVEALQEAVKTAGTDESLEAEQQKLQRVIGTAYEVGIPVNDPMMVKAATLLTAVEAAVRSAEDEGEEAEEAAGLDEEAQMNAKLDSLFDGGYALPPDVELDF
jgi:hypothetical protein